MADNLLGMMVGRLGRSPEFPGKWRIIRTISSLAGPIAVRSSYGPLMTARVEDYTNRAAIFGMYDARVQEAVNKLATGDVFLDVGANAGVWSLLAASRVGPEGVVVSFEPQRQLAQELRSNAALNAFENLIVFDIALGDETRWMRMTKTKTEHTGVSFVSPSGDGAKTLVVDPRSDLHVLQRLCDGRNVVIKIDVEGAELSVLNGLTELMRHHNVSAVVVEVNAEYMARFSHDPEQIYSKMTELGFRTLGARPGYAHYDEVFLR